MIMQYSHRYAIIYLYNIVETSKKCENLQNLEENMNPRPTTFIDTKLLSLLCIGLFFSQKMVDLAKLIFLKE